MQDTYEERSQWLIQRLIDYDKTLKSRIEQTCKNFNTTIRGHIRTETALRLGASTEEGTTSIPVRITGDFPYYFHTIILDVAPRFWDLFLNRSLLRRTSTGLAYLNDELFYLASLIQSEEAGNYGFMPEDIAPIKTFTDNIIKIIDDNGILSHIGYLDHKLNLRSELLGAYFFEIPEIYLFWPAIALTAIELDTSVEALTVVALTHELVHAYTHLGQDTDNDRWDTEAFNQTHPFIVEGLAQFYTEVICRKLAARQPDALATFHKLLTHLPEPYTAYQNWTHRSSGRSEIIRSAMIESRKNQITDLDNFMEALKIAHSRIARQ